MDAARDKMLRGRLFIPQSLAQQCDSYFRGVLGGRLNFSLANHSLIDPAKKGEFWDAAATAAHDELPKILYAIEHAARAVIHGEQV